MQKRVEFRTPAKTFYEPWEIQIEIYGKTFGPCEAS
jgi:hypothetical protein